MALKAPLSFAFLTDAKACGILHNKAHVTVALEGPETEKSWGFRKKADVFNVSVFKRAETTRHLQILQN